MEVIPLYLSDVIAPDSFEALVMLVQLVKAGIGIAIAIIAYQGYKKQSSRPMFFLAAGFILVLGLPFILYLGAGLSMLLLTVPEFMQAGIILLAELSQVAGLCAIVFALQL